MMHFSEFRALLEPGFFIPHKAMEYREPGRWFKKTTHIVPVFLYRKLSQHLFHPAVGISEFWCSV